MPYSLHVHGVRQRDRKGHGQGLFSPVRGMLKFTSCRPNGHASNSVTRGPSFMNSEKSIGFLKYAATDNLATAA